MGAKNTFILRMAQIALRLPPQLAAAIRLLAAAR